MISLFVVSAFGFLWACKKRGTFLTETEGPRFLAQFFCELTEIFFQVCVLYGVFQFGIAPLTPSNEMSLAPFFIIMGAYLLKLIRRTKDFSLWQVVAMTFLYAEILKMDHFGVFLKLWFAHLLLMVFFCLALLGMERRLLFSNIPVGARGLPLLMLNMVILLLGVWGFQGVLF